MEYTAVIGAAEWACSFCDRLFEEWGLPYTPSRITRKRGAYCTIGGLEYQITIGTNGVEYWLEKGFREYSTLRHLWPPQREMIGYKGVWAACLHEFAHALQAEAGGVFNGSVHNGYFSRALRLLQKKYPWEKIEKEVRKYVLRRIAIREINAASR